MVSIHLYHSTRKTFFFKLHSQDILPCCLFNFLPSSIRNAELEIVFPWMKRTFCLRSKPVSIYGLKFCRFFFSQFCLLVTRNHLSSSALNSSWSILLCVMWVHCRLGLSRFLLPSMTQRGGSHSLKISVSLFGNQISVLNLTVLII